MSATAHRTKDRARMGETSMDTQMNTLQLLIQKFGPEPLIGAETVCRDYFAPLTYAMFLRKCSAGDISLPLVAMGSQKSEKKVHVTDLAAYIDKKAVEARKELRKLAY